MKNILLIFSALVCFSVCYIEAIKEGSCPEVKADMVGICVHECDNDDLCPGHQKCCSNGCGQVCKDPAINNLKLANPVIPIVIFSSNDEAWELYKTTFEKVYTAEEEPLKRKIWDESVKLANGHNLLYAKGDSTWLKGVNQFSDGTQPGKGLLQRKTPPRMVRYYMANNKSWIAFKTEFNKTYARAEEVIRHKMWTENVQKVNKHNSGYKSGVFNYTMEVNQFADGTQLGKGLIVTPENQTSAFKTNFASLFYEANNHTWKDYLLRFGKNFSTIEEPEKRKTWEKTIEEVNLHNKEYIAGNHTWLKGINQFSDGTQPSKGLLATPALKKYNLIKTETYLTNNKEWTAYKTQFNKNYTSVEEESIRRKNWEDSVTKANAHNEKYRNGKQSYTQGVNQFSDGTRPGFGLFVKPEPNTYGFKTQIKKLFHIADNKTWIDYKNKFDKNYTSEKEPEKRKNWEKSIDEVNAHNKGYANGTYSWYNGINQFSDGTKPAMGLLMPPQPKTEFKKLFHEANNDTWAKYQKEFNKNYTPEEEPERRQTWEKSIEEVNLHNREYAKGVHTWTQGINQFSDGLVPGKGYISKPNNLLKKNEPEVLEVNDANWLAYKMKHNKLYTVEDEPLKRKAWEDSIKGVNAHNQEFSVEKHTYKQGINQFSDGSRPYMGFLQKPQVNPDYIKMKLEVNKFKTEHIKFTDLKETDASQSNEDNDDDYDYDNDSDEDIDDEDDWDSDYDSDYGDEDF